MTIFDKKEIRTEHISPYISRQYEVEVKSEQCFAVKDGYEVAVMHRTRSDVSLNEALTIRSAEEVRREGFRAGIEAAAGVCSKLADTAYEDYLVDGSEGYYLSQASNCIRALTAQKGDKQ